MLEIRPRRRPTYETPLRPIKVTVDPRQLAWVASLSYQTQLIQAAIERKGKSRR